MADDQLHVVMFPFFAFGHVSPFIQLSNKLSSHGVRISFFTIPGFIPRIQNLLIPSPTTQIVPLQLPPSLGFPPNIAGTFDFPSSVSPKFVVAIDLIQPQVKALLSELKPDFVLLDFAQNWLPSLASELGIKTMLFSVFSGIANAYLLAPGRLTGIEGPPSVDDLRRPPQGFPKRFGRNNVNVADSSSDLIKTFEAQNILFVYKSKISENASIYDRFQGGLSGSTAVVIKSCFEMEGPYLDFMKSQLNKPFIVTGPLVPQPPSEKLDAKWDKWLAQFPSKSVIFCSFGSEAVLNQEQIREVALGLELTGLPFLLVLHFPAKVNAKTELEHALPIGFFERTKDMGIVHVGWVPQQLILRHNSVGCYLCHAGFSSLIEGLVNDCQLVLLPLQGDQFFNSMLMCENGIMKAGIEVNRRDRDGYFGKEDIFAAVQTIMTEIEKEPGKSIRSNQKKWHKFLQEKDVQEKYISDMISEMKKILVDNPFVD
ncbi:Anthocyanidin 3-O-glucosyltransferase [Morus notabilis]|uniref:Glycosyltransferase n=1 Tax=Morus notabilis TaxID=981085 RepID=W9QMY9_9ROSA|nr:anthocyanidin 3-O-glucosyltransferase [Morus notabilis]EXB44194.1 Anthocyanidin 3-O-glucosyltransferase [Morus notabilis]